MTDPLEGTLQEREDYVKKVFNMIDQDVDERKKQRLEEFQRSRETKAVLNGGVGGGDAIVKATGGLLDA